jgi:hypothetical protein
MTTNIVDKVIDKKDLELIEKLAEKYDMSIVEFGRFLGKKSNEKGVRFQIRFSVDELAYVDEKSNMMDVSRSKYCQMAYQWFVENNIFKSMDISDFKESDGKKSERVSVLFSDADQYKSMRKMASDFSIPFSALLRYCALNYKTE